MTTSTDGEEFLAACIQALAAAPAEDALQSLGWWDALGDLDDPMSRSAVLSYFRAQGRQLGDSAALGGLMAMPYLEQLGESPGAAVAMIARTSNRRGSVLVHLGPLEGRQLLVDVPGAGTSLVLANEVVLHPVSVPGRLTLREVEVDPAERRLVLSEGDTAAARARSAELGRIALSLEMLGAAESALALAIEHARAREQFGRPIGVFQAVRHHLAWASAMCEAVDAATAWAATLEPSRPPRHAEIVKALSGRNALRACERSLQVLGAIGFTAEHDHHHYHSRVLALDGLLGTSAVLTRQLGEQLRRDPSSIFVTSHALTGLDA